MKNKKGAINLIDIIVGLIIIAGGSLYILGQASIGAIITTIGLLIELIVRFVK